MFKRCTATAADKLRPSPDKFRHKRGKLLRHHRKNRLSILQNWQPRIRLNPDRKVSGFKWATRTYGCGPTPQFAQTASAPPLARPFFCNSVPETPSVTRTLAAKVLKQNVITIPLLRNFIRRGLTLTWLWPHNTQTYPFHQIKTILFPKYYSLYTIA